MNRDVRRLLIVEDEPELLEVLSEHMMMFDIVHTAVPNAEDALRLIKTESITAVLTDISMPGKTGFQLLQEVRELGYAVPFMILTAHDSNDNLKKALRLGVVDFVVKPFDPNQLRDSSYRALEIGALNQEKARILQDSIDTGKRTKLKQNEKQILKLNVSSLKK